MLKEEGGRGSGREVARVLGAFARTARARRLYQPNNAVLKRLMSELSAGLQALLTQKGEISLRVRPDALFYEDEMVLEEPSPEDSIPFTFYRDGIRRLDLQDGLDAAELAVLVSATAEGFAQSGLGDDVVSFLWRHELTHVRTVVVDTTIVDAGAKPAPSGERAPVMDVDEQIDALIHEIYGHGREDDVGPRSVRVDASDLSAKDIAQALGDVDEMAPGFHPARTLVEPLYALVLRAQAEEEDEELLALRAAEHAVAALSQGSGLEPGDRRAASDGLLSLYDAALVAGRYALAARTMAAVRQAADPLAVEDAATAWITEAVAEVRLRQLALALQAPELAPELMEGLFMLLEASGPRAVPAILGMIPDVQDPSRRRALADTAVRAGIEKLDPVRALLVSEQAFVAVEAVYILSLLADEPKAAQLMAMAAGHAQPAVRRAFLGEAHRLPQAERLTAVVQLLEDPDLEVRVAAAHRLGSIRDVQALRAIEARVKRPDLSGEPLEMKQALVGAYVTLSGAKTLPTLAKWFQDGGGVFAKREAEELAIAAARGLARLATPGAVAALKKAATFLNMRVREAAQQALRDAAQSRRPREEG